MCGIVGIYNAGGIAPDREHLEAMSRAIKHRGPDEVGCHYAPRVHMGCRRLSIIDVGGGGQPIFSRDGRLCIVYNGEVYNFAELRGILLERGHRFTTRTDTEVVLHAYEEWKDKCLERFRGMFAFAIWDSERGELFLARDRMGIKPLYYSTLPDGTFLFASEIKALLTHPRMDRRLHVPAVDNLLTYGFNVAPHTFFRGIRQVLPGHYVRLSASGMRQVEYWDIDMDAPRFEDDEPEIARRLRAELERAVASTLVSDVPVAAYLSGGIDSSAVTGIYSSLSGGRVKALSITFDDADYDEVRFSRDVSRHFHTDTTEFTSRVGEDALERLTYHMEDPLSTLLQVPLYQLSSKAREEGFKVVLTGDGADEILGGYDYFKLLKVMRFIGRGETPFRRNVLRRIIPSLKTSVHADIQYLFFRDYPVVHPAMPYRFQLYPLKDELYSAHYKDALASSEPDDPMWFDPGKIAHRSLLDQALYMETKMRLLNLTLPLADKMSMAHSVEVRPCFLDHELVDFVFRIPDRFKMRGLREKHILKLGMRGVLPDHICARKKQPLQPPGRPFIDSVLPAVKRVLSKRHVKEKGYFNPAFIARALDRYRTAGRWTIPVW